MAQWPIIQKFEAYGDYPFEAIDPSVIVLLEQANARSALPSKQKLKFRILLRALECFLQITNQCITAVSLGRPEFREIYRGFVGALNSEQFLKRTLLWRHSMTRSLNVILLALEEPVAGQVFQPVASRSTGRTGDIESCIAEFNRLPLREESVWLWRGWIAPNKFGALIILPLYPIYARLGRNFTEKLYDVCCTYLGARRRRIVPFLRPLAQFIGRYEKGMQSSDFQDSRFVTTFWRDFLVYYMITGYSDGNGAQVSTLVREWRTGVAGFVSEALEASGLVADHLGHFPSPEPKGVPGSRTHVRTTAEGHEVKTKLLTVIPLHMTDEQALELLFHQIETDFRVFVDWATWATKSIWSRYNRRLELAAQGEVRQLQPSGTRTKGNRLWVTSRENPRHLSNAAATLRHHGFLTDRDAGISHLYPKPLTQTAEELGLPGTDALFPHCVLLVADHPSITPSFLENLELFDRNGKLTGFVASDGGRLLVGNKFRCGANHAAQQVVLTARGVEIVEQIVALTQPLRDYLRDRRDDNWRYLLLTCKQGFAYPAAVRFLAQTTTVPNRLEMFAHGLGNTCKLGFDERMELVRRFSLPALRASAGVLEYLRTGSAEKMARMLGHARYDHNLLSCYLPEPILNFFQERWVRIFQTGVIVEAMKDSEFLLRATDFRNMSELDAFLRNHALKTLPARLRTTDQDVEADVIPNREVVFGISKGILTTLISLQLAVARSVTQVSAKANYWAGLTTRLVAYIQSELSNRVDLQEYLAVARQAADPSSMEHLIHG